MEGVLAVSVAQDPGVKKLCLEEQAWGMPLSLPCPVGPDRQNSLVKSGDYTLENSGL